MATTAAELVVEIRGREVGLDAMLRRIETDLRRLDSSSQRVGANMGSGLARGQRQAADGAVTHAQALARLQTTQGDYTGAQDTLASALARTNDGTLQSIRVKTQLAQVQNRLSGQTQSLSTMMGQLGGQLSGLGGSVGGLAGSFGQLASSMGTLGVIGAGLGLVTIAGEMAVAGANADLVRQRFDELAVAAGTTGNALLTAMRAASGGEISDLNLQLAANRAQLLGVASGAEELAVLMSIARDRAQQLGLSTTQAFNDLVTGLGRASPEILDNLAIQVSAEEANKRYAQSIGKTVEELTKAERTQALVNAVIQQGTTATEGAAGAVDSAAGTYARLGAALQNAANRAGTFISAGLEPQADMFADLLGIVEGSADAYVNAADGVINFSRSIQGLPPLTGAAAEWQHNLNNTLLDFLGILPGATEGNLQLANATDIATNAKANNSTATADNAAATDGAYLAMGNMTNAIYDNAAASLIAESQTTLLSDAKAELHNAAIIAAQGQDSASDAAALLASRFNIAYGEALKLIGALRAIGNLGGGAVKGLAKGMGGGLGEFALGSNFATDGVSGRGGFFRQVEAQEARSASRRRAGAAKAGAQRMSDQQRLDNQLLAEHEKFLDRLEDSEEEHRQRLLDIERDFQRKSAQQERENETSKRRSRADFYDGLTESTELLGDDVANSLSAAYEEAFAKSQELAQSGNAKLAADYLALKEEQLNAELQYQERVAQAREEKDAGEIDRLERIHKLRQQQFAEEEKQLLAAGDANVNARSEAVEGESTRYAEEQARIIEENDRATERKILNAQRSGKAVEAERLEVDRLATSYERLNTVNGGRVSAGTSGSTTTDGSAPASTGAPAPGGGDAMATALASLREAIDAVERATRESGKGVESAIGRLGSSLVR